MENTGKMKKSPPDCDESRAGNTGMTDDSTSVQTKIQEMLNAITVPEEMDWKIPFFVTRAVKKSILDIRGKVTDEFGEGDNHQLSWPILNRFAIDRGLDPEDLTEKISSLWRKCKVSNNEAHSLSEAVELVKTMGPYELPASPLLYTPRLRKDVAFVLGVCYALSRGKRSFFLGVEALASVLPDTDRFRAGRLLKLLAALRLIDILKRAEDGKTREFAMTREGNKLMSTTLPEDSYDDDVDDEDVDDDDDVDVDDEVDTVTNPKTRNLKT